MNASSPMNRRTLLGALAATVLGGRMDAARADAIITRPIPSTDEKLPAVGLGSWITFNVGYDQAARASCAEVIKNFFEAGGPADRLLADVRLLADGDRPWAQPARQACGAVFGR